MYPVWIGCNDLKKKAGVKGKFEWRLILPFHERWNRKNKRFMNSSDSGNLLMELWVKSKWTLNVVTLLKLKKNTRYNQCIYVMKLFELNH